MESENNLFFFPNQFTGMRVLVIGEAILDSMVRGAAERLSLEAPVPVVDAREIVDIPGGAANVAVNAARLGAQVELLSVIGEDAEGTQLLDLLRAQGVKVDQVIRHPGRRTLLKRRIYAGQQLLVRYDQGTTDPVDEETEARLLADLKTRCRKADVVILSDYGQGVLNRAFLSGLARIQEKHPCVLVADTRRLEDYRGLHLAAIRPSHLNAVELLEASGSNGNGSGKNGAANGGGDGAGSASVSNIDRLAKVGTRLLKTLDTQMVAITLDEGGALVFDRNEPVYRAYAPEMAFNQVSGAGDSFIAGLALALGRGAPGVAASEIATAVASLVLQNGGKPICCLEELQAHLSGDQKLVQEWPVLAARLDMLRQQGKRIVFTNGVFDILHSAHVAYLNQAKSFGDVLVVGINADASVKRLKGPARPINGELERMRVLAGLSCVDLVSCFSEDNPINLIHIVRPDVYVKGGDYTRETLPEAEVVEQYGGALRLVTYIPDHSTTGVIEKIRGGGKSGQ
jgi:D-beta-D-heptose 7-phosphate kinase/D-beta-D-heptose 1-phosphate adenosyltransferase